MRDQDELFAALGRSRFRARFTLATSDCRYVARKGYQSILHQARQFVTERLAPRSPRNDGKQTPMRGHPVFVAQHATATCCRKCLARWHRIPAGQPLSDEAVTYIVGVLDKWLSNQLLQSPGETDRQLRLFAEQDDG